MVTKRQVYGVLKRVTSAIQRLDQLSGSVLLGPPGAPPPPEAVDHILKADRRGVQDVIAQDLRSALKELEYMQRVAE